ncbi:replication factor C subunit 1-like [Pyrus ussuriensis x Pyrus communis]|uniref:Replication factor C subunit 1-like n=1 Tax=Pyrus ussuriensis x Pyrus communis TaxID=2448454 RepID=A0A5N5EWA2_9ROSA|nr:replication factor C subunit 1-like [Pyrus ussuriensis x Pyrus communis]
MYDAFAALLRGQRETLEQGERNFNRFGGWLGKNSTLGKNRRLLEDLHVHLLASRESSSGRETVRVEYLSLLLKRLTMPLRELPKDEAVQEVVEFMNTYSISQDDFDTIVELSKYQGHPNPLDGIVPAVKAALTKAYKEGSKTRMVRAADFVTIPGMKKAPKKRIAALLEPSDDAIGENIDDTLVQSEDENSSDTEDLEGSAVGEKLQKELQSLNTKGVQVQFDLKGAPIQVQRRHQLAGVEVGSAAAASVKKGGSRFRSWCQEKEMKGDERRDGTFPCSVGRVVVYGELENSWRLLIDGFTVMGFAGRGRLLLVDKLRMSNNRLLQASLQITAFCTLTVPKMVEFMTRFSS